MVVSTIESLPVVTDAEDVGSRGNSFSERCGGGRIFCTSPEARTVSFPENSEENAPNADVSDMSTLIVGVGFSVCDSCSYMGSLTESAGGTISLPLSLFNASWSRMSEESMRFLEAAFSGITVGPSTKAAPW